MKLKEWRAFNENRKKGWWEFLEQKELAEVYAGRQEKLKQVVQEYKKKDRTTEILVLHGSSRSSGLDTCAKELSNSQLLLEHGLKLAEPELGEVNIERVNLREYDIETCNYCVSTTSPLCGFPCDCYPDDDMQKLYPMVLRSDIMLISTGVYQSAMAVKLKGFVDRLVSVDGGFYRNELQPKNFEFRGRMIELGKSHKFAYDQRLFGRVCGYFISTKDENNPADQDNPMSFGTIVGESLKGGFRDYGCFHPDPAWIIVAGKWDEDYAYDKQRLNEDTGVHEQAKNLVLSCLNLHRELKAVPPEFDPGRVNRT